MCCQGDVMSIKGLATICKNVHQPNADDLMKLKCKLTHHEYGIIIKHANLLVEMVLDNPPNDRGVKMIGDIFGRYP
jgi:hypothetical protein